MSTLRLGMKILGDFPENTSLEIKIKNQIENSILDVYCEQNENMESVIYVVCKCFIMEFGNMSDFNDKYSYVGRKVVFCREPDIINKDNVKEIFEECSEFKTRHLVKFIEGVKYVDGEYWW